MSDCYCDYDGDVTLHEQRVIKGRKAHRCCECRTDIAKGEEHRVDSYLWEGEFYRDRTCTPCTLVLVEVERVAHEHKLCVCPSVGNLAEILLEELDNDLWTPPIRDFFDRRARARDERKEARAALQTSGGE